MSVVVSMRWRKGNLTGVCIEHAVTFAGWNDALHCWREKIEAALRLDPREWDVTIELCVNDRQIWEYRQRRVM